MKGRIPSEAFELYVSMGATRSYEGVAAHYGATKRGVSKRASREGWSQRLAEIERKAREKADERIVDTMEELRARHLKMLRAMAARAMNALVQYPLNSGMEAVRAAELTIKLERLVGGASTEQITVTELLRGEYASLLCKVEQDDRDS